MSFVRTTGRPARNGIVIRALRPAMRPYSSHNNYKTANISALGAVVPHCEGAFRVLIVDDNVDAADSLAFLLGAWGYDTHTAHDGLAAIAASDECRPHVIILDISMPRMNGYDAARHFRRHLGQAVTLIALTARSLSQDRLRAFEAGFDHHIVKPADLDRLRELLPVAR
jgi:CheY-like chemotaxis protein